MAGIGFTLRRMLGEKGLAGPIKAFSYAALVSAGPWLTSSLALAALGIWSAFGHGSQEMRAFLAIVNYCFAFSLVGVGFTQLVASRYLADRLFEGKLETFSPAFAAILAPLLGVQALLAMAFLWFVPLPLPVLAGALVLYLALNGTFLAMVFLSAAHDYRAVALAFVAGCATSLGGALWGGQLWGLAGQVCGFAAGTSLTFVALSARIDREFGPPTGEAPGLGRYFIDMWPLAFAGFAYNLAVWTDKLLFWYHPDTRDIVAGPLHASPVYDDAMFLAFMTIVPTLALFLMKVETDFYDKYRAYFATIASRDSLARLLTVKDEMARVVRESLGLVIKIQGTITFFVVLLAPEIVARVGTNWLSAFVFRTGAIGAFMHALHLIVWVLLQYFDFRKEAAAVAACFLFSNFLFTLIAFSGGLPAYGYGYAASSAVTLLFGLVLLDRNLRDLEYHIFMKQPL